MTASILGRLSLCVATLLISLPGVSLADHFARGSKLSCTEEAAQGLAWGEEGNAVATDFVPVTYSVKIISDELRHIWQPGLGYRLFLCESLEAGVSRCAWKGTTFLFREHAFATSFLFGKPIGTAPNLSVAYGACELED